MRTDSPRAAACARLPVTRCDFTRSWRRRTPPLLRSLTDSSPSLCGRQAAHTRRDGASGRVRRREGREHLLRPGRFLHASPDHPQTDVVGFLRGGVQLHRERGLHQHRQRAAALRLQQQRRRLQLWRHCGRGLFPGQHLFPDPGRLLSLHQQHPGQKTRRPAGPRLLRPRQLPVVRWLLFSGQSVAGDLSRRAAIGPGLRRRQSHHHLLLLLHPLLDRADAERTATLPDGQQNKLVHMATSGGRPRQRSSYTVSHRQRCYHSNHQPLSSPALH